MGLRRNNYSGKCLVCKASVAEHAGYILKVNGKGRWQTCCSSPHCMAEAGLEEPAESPRRLRYENGEAWVEMPYDPNALTLQRAFPGARWDAARKVRTVSTDPADRKRVLEIAAKLGLEVDEAFNEVPVDEDVSALVERGEAAGLYPFQLEGVKWLAPRRKALLADDMGLGKTVQVLMSLPAEGNCVCVVPASVKYNWAAEVNMWRADLTPVVIEGRGNCRPPAEGEVVIVNYDILPEEPAGYEGVTLVVDEAHYAKTFRRTKDKATGEWVIKANKNCTKRAARCAKLAEVAGKTWILTGTPMMNRPFDLKGMLDAFGMFNEVFGGWNTFIRLFNGYQDGWGGWEFSPPGPEVAERMRRVMLRRMKDDVLADMPPKRFTTLTVNGHDNEVYEEMDRLWDEWGDVIIGGELPPFEEFSSMRAMLAKSRIDAAIEWVENYEDGSDKPLVVYSAHRAPAEALGSREGWAIIWGDTPQAKRTEIVEAFQAGELKGVACVIAAAAEGLTLTAADTMLFIDLDWRPKKNEQAEDRIRRISQESESLLYVRMTSDHPLDKHVMGLLTSKTEMIDAAIDGEAEYTVPEEPEANNETREEWEARMTEVREAAERVREARESAARETWGTRVEQIARRQSERATAPERELTPELLDTIETAHDYMLSVCDGAVEKDGAGFNKPDAQTARILTRYDIRENGDAARALERMLTRYHRQLSGSFPALFERGDS